MRACFGYLFAVSLLTGLAAATGLQAEELRKASLAEIKDYVSKKTHLTELSNGWSYRSNNKYGYKFADGSMCVRTTNGSVSCTKIVTDGKKFFMVSPDGQKTPFKDEG
jgi:hypothetical protein